MKTEKISCGCMQSGILSFSAGRLVFIVIEFIRYDRDEDSEYSSIELSKT